MLLAETTPVGSLLDVVLGPEGSQVLFVSTADLAGPAPLFIVDVKAPAPPVELSAPLAANERVTWPKFSPDGRRAFYLVRHEDVTTTHHLWQADIAAPGVAQPVSDPAHGVGHTLFLPPVGE